MQKVVEDTWLFLQKKQKLVYFGKKKKKQLHILKKSQEQPDGSLLHLDQISGVAADANHGLVKGYQAVARRFAARSGF